MDTEFITPELIDEWEYAINDIKQQNSAWGAQATIILYDHNEEQFKPLFVFPEESIPLVARQLPYGCSAVVIIKEETLLEEILFSIFYFWRNRIEN